VCGSKERELEQLIYEINTFPSDAMILAYSANPARCDFRKGHDP